MRLIPVIDLLDGQAVHAVIGKREHYRPVKSVLCDTPDPFEVATAFRDRLGLNEIYIADLDAIQGARQVNHREMIAALAGEEDLNIILDAGVSDVENTRTWLDLGVRKVVIGAETLRTWDALQDIPAKVDRDRLIFSLDSHAGKILSQTPALAALSPMKALEHLQAAGWQEVLLLDLRLVGSGEGVDRKLASEARRNFPDLSLLVGGGLARAEELAELEAMGVAGVLAATALHYGTITAQHLAALVRNPS
jgi:phosphoribosylformimino-5-aminoimidazole carboxamide ribotide isomerase